MTSSPCCAGRVAAGPPPPRPGADRTVTGERSTRGQRLLPGGVVAMGDVFGEGYPADGEGPVHDVELAPFHMDETAVTNAAFAAFVRETGHVTDAEELGVSAVFHLAVAAGPGDVLQRVEQAPWWLAVRGADWRHPEGTRSDVAERSHHPVVHVSWRDASAYAAWAGKRLPTEAEWEHAARGGLVGARFAWGDELTPGGKHRCNVWQGRFPHENTADDGYVTTAPVKTYRPNGFGLWNCSGNTWEWCADWFSPDYYAECLATSQTSGGPVVAPAGPIAGEARVMRGGSFLCHESYCHRYRVAARSSNTPDSAAANIGFRCANDA